MIDPPAGDASAFVDKWRGAWPEWALVQGFIPAAQRDVADAWNALQFELQEAAWGGADARPGEAKLAWWSEELVGWSLGRRRHPLGAVLQRRQAPWADLARTLPTLAASRARPANPGAAHAQVDSIATVVATIDVALFGGDSNTDAAARAWLAARLARHPNDAVPLDQPTPATWARALSHDWPSTRGLAAVRRMELALIRARLKRGDAAVPSGPLTALWAGWRAARD